MPNHISDSYKMYKCNTDQLPCPLSTRQTNSGGLSTGNNMRTTTMEAPDGTSENDNMVTYVIVGVVIAIVLLLSTVAVVTLFLRRIMKKVKKCTKYVHP